jgi:hypothetical protein
MIFMTGVDRLAEMPLNRTQIAKFLVPQMVSGSGDLMLFESFVNTTASSPKDARNVLPPSNGYQAPSDPLTVGVLFGSPVLLDGYHRAVLFWRFANQDALINSYLPLQLVSAS